MTDWTPVPNMHYPVFTETTPKPVKPYSPKLKAIKKKFDYSKTKQAAEYRLDMLMADKLREELRED